MLKELLEMIRKMILTRRNMFFAASYDYLPQPLGKEEEDRLILLMHNGDEDAKKALIEHNIRLVVYIARRYDSGSSSEDLISIGTIGLIKAINTFDSSKK